jgi:hypothetical protein
VFSLKAIVEQHNTSTQKVDENPLLAFQSKKNGSGEEIFPDDLLFIKHANGKVQYISKACDSTMTYNGKEMSGWLSSKPATNLPQGDVNGIRFCFDEKTLLPVAPWFNISIGDKWIPIDKFCWDEDEALLTDATAFLPKPVKLNTTAKGFKFTLEFRHTTVEWPGPLDLSYETLLPLNPLADPYELPPPPPAFHLDQSSSSLQSPSPFVGLTPLPGLGGDLSLGDEVVEAEGVVVMPQSDTDPLGLDLDLLTDGTTQLMDRFVAACSDNEFKAQRIAALEAQLTTLRTDLKTSKDSVQRLELDLKLSQDNETHSLARIQNLETSLSKKRKAEELDRESIKRAHAVTERLTALLAPKPIPVLSATH